MNEWRKLTLGDVADLSNGANFTKASFGSGLKILGVRDFGDRMVPDWSAMDEIKPTALGSERQLLAEGDLVFVRSNGNPALVGRSMRVTAGPVATHSAFTIKARPHRDIVEPRFLAYQMRNAHRVGQMRAANGTNITNLSQPILARVPILVPSRDTQLRICGVLGSIDDLIENNRRRIEVLEEMARVIYREWFVKFRYPGHDRVAFIDSALGPIPDGWAHRNLFQVADVGFGFSYGSSRFADAGPFQIIRIRNIPVGISSTYSDEQADLRYAVIDDDVLIGMDGDFHMTVWTGGAAWLNQRVTRLRPKIELSPLHLLLAVEGQIVDWNHAIVGTTVAHLGKKHLELVTVLIPDPPTLAMAGEIFNPLMVERRSLEQASRRLVAMRDLLLPRLVSGQIDVSILNLDGLLEKSVA